MIGVSAPEETRLLRVMERDGTDAASIRQRMHNQMDEEEKMKRCDFIILNDGSRMVIPQVLELHRQLLSLAAAKASHA